MSQEKSKEAVNTERLANLSAKLKTIDNDELRLRFQTVLEESEEKINQFKEKMEVYKSFDFSLADAVLKCISVVCCISLNSRVCCNLQRL